MAVVGEDDPAPAAESKLRQLHSGTKRSDYVSKLKQRDFEKKVLWQFSCPTWMKKKKKKHQRLFTCGLLKFNFIIKREKRKKEITLIKLC